ncbi:dipeptidase PepV [Thermoanaerobacterium thermosaccharolyticum]|uniref:Dipeptidase PepV n=1 Tax=Thermoanaerobacterium thermosaccharolyticum TaxID=1517 RepID=A0A231VM69_THETR|nr:dipeptidase PepV [Thermoanaerobacterium thermosaccharolyticum]KAA5807505.1 dipeptidase PepV [Thermoanaerobacterium thermosaccharolyticum]OXT09198.1 dipeptidase PepV [Thermoanaerobacterium thermosaccharolyticum]
MILDQYVDILKDELVRSTQEIIKIKSTEGEPKPGMPYGEGPGKALEKALMIADSLGFKTKNVDGYVGYAEYGEGDEMVGVLGHLDVVPEGDGWDYPPYGAEIHDGKIYGRGATDDKGPIMASLYALKAIKDSGLKLSKRVRILFGTNEETGSKEIEYYLKHEEAPTIGFTPDANYPVIYAEKGITIFNVVKDFKEKSDELAIKYIKGGNRPNMVPDYCESAIVVKDEKRRQSIPDEVKRFREVTGFDIDCGIENDMLVIKSHGESAHGSLPYLGKNAIMQLILFLNVIYQQDDDVKKFIDFFAKNVGLETNGKTFGVNLKDDTGELSFNVGTINLNEEKGTIGLNIRYPVTFKYEDLMNPFNEKIGEYGMRVENMMHQPPLYFPKDHFLIKTLMKVYEDVTGRKDEPLSIGGGTYAKEMKNMVAFGPIFPGKPDLDHQANEYIEIDDLILNAKIYARAIYELAK